MPAVIRPWINGRPAPGRRRSEPVTHPWDDRVLADDPAMKRGSNLRHNLLGSPGTHVIPSCWIPAIS